MLLISFPHLHFDNVPTFPLQVQDKLWNKVSNKLKFSLTSWLRFIYDSSGWVQYHNGALGAGLEPGLSRALSAEKVKFSWPWERKVMPVLFLETAGKKQCKQENRQGA